VAAVTVAEDGDALVVAAAERITVLIERAIAERGGAVVCLTGGRTPQRLYERLADAGHPWRDRIDWARVHLFWGDERHVPPGHADSNFGMAHRALVAHVPIPAAQVHRMRGEIADATAAAQDYDRALSDGFSRAGRTDRTFDVMLLGLGEDAHIASIFPGSALLGSDPMHNSTQGLESIRVGGSDPMSRSVYGGLTPLVAGVWAEHLGAWRITLTPRALLDARALLVLVAGEAKAAAVHAALKAPEGVSRSPAQLLRQAGDRVEWLLDRAAAAAI
jgi:6-phosphogluconolactonase